MFFKPIVFLRPDFNPHYYTMEACLLAPNGCFAAGPAVPEWPKGAPVSADTQPMQLIVEKRHGPCPQGFTLLKYGFSGLSCENNPQFRAMSILDGEVSQSTDVGTPCPEPRLAGKAERDPWKAIIVEAAGGWVSSNPGLLPTLHAFAVISAPTGCSFILKEVGPIGFTQKTLLFELQAKVPKDAGPMVTTYLEFEDVTIQTEDQYDSVAVDFNSQRVHGSVLPPIFS